jgi:hypothetical protein
MFHIPPEPDGTLLDVHRASAATVSRLCSSSGEGAEHASPSIRRMVMQEEEEEEEEGTRVTRQKLPAPTTTASSDPPSSCCCAREGEFS